MNWCCWTTNCPGSSGLEVLAQIQKLPASQQPAVIMLTASGSEAPRSKP